jgi:hypothetical protein
MPHYFCDFGNAGAAGGDMDDAVDSLEDILDVIVPVGGSWIWVRRATTDNTTSGITFAGRRSPELPLIVSGWPRAAVAIASSDWTNGSTTVTIDDGGMVARAHELRYITAPDGERYLIEKVTGASTIIISVPYLGTTVTNQAASIHKDELYDTAHYSDTFTAATTDILTLNTALTRYLANTSGPFRLTTTDTLPAGLSTGTDYYIIRLSSTSVKLATTQANAEAGTAVDITDTGTGTHSIHLIDDAAWTIKKSTWDADAHTLHVIDYGNGASGLAAATTDAGHEIHNISFENSNQNPYGILSYTGVGFRFVGCHFRQDAGATKNSMWMSQGSGLFERCLFYQLAAIGNVYITTSARPHFIDTMFRDGTYSLILDSCPGAIFEGCNFGVADGASTADLKYDAVTQTVDSRFRNCRWGGSVAAWEVTEYTDYRILSQNHNGSFGAIYYKDAQGTVETVTAGAGGAVPNQRTGGSATLLKISNTGVGTGDIYKALRRYHDNMNFMEQHLAINGSKTITYWLQTPIDLHQEFCRIEAHYLKAKTSTTEFLYQRDVVRTFIPARDDTDDWDSISITVETPELSVVSLQVFLDQFNATNSYYLDPLPTVV